MDIRNSGPKSAKSTTTARENSLSTRIMVRVVAENMDVKTFYVFFVTFFTFFNVFFSLNL